MVRNNRPLNEEHLDDFEVMYVEAVGGLNGAQAAFQDLEGRLHSLRNRRLFGTFNGECYRACVMPKDADEPRFLRLETWTIPGGRYARRKLVNWEDRVHTIGEEFDAMSDEHSWDETRPSIEFYRSRRDLILYLPILG